MRLAAVSFGMLLIVGNNGPNKSPNLFRSLAFAALGVFVPALTTADLTLATYGSSPRSAPTPQAAQQPQLPPTQAPAPQVPAPAAPAPRPTEAISQEQPPAAKPGLNIVVLDPAHGGTDLGARGTGGIHESEIVLDFVRQIRRALELHGFEVIQTRQGNENPSFDDRSALANAQRGAVFVTLHIASTGLPGTVRVYVLGDLPAANDLTGLISWDRAQAPFLLLSRKLGDSVQGFLSQRFKGSPTAAQTATVRQLRTTAAPAIAVEISSVTVENRDDLDRMEAGVAESIALAAAGFRSSYATPGNPGDRP